MMVQQVQLQASNKPQVLNSDGGILKFVNKYTSERRLQGKKCNPYRQFGVSKDSPMQFILKNSLISDSSQFKPTFLQSNKKREMFSQRNFFTIGSSQTNQGQSFTNQFKKSQQQNKNAFRRMSSQVSRFYQKNAWMGDRFYVMGHQRSEKALQADRVQNHIRARTQKNLSLSKKNSRSQSGLIRTRQTFTSTNSLSEKNRIREMRNMLAKKEDIEQSAVRPHTSLSFGEISRNNSFSKVVLPKRPKQFSINIPEWGESDFAVKLLEWNPERNNQ